MAKLKALYFCCLDYVQFAKLSLALTFIRCFTMNTKIGQLE